MTVGCGDGVVTSYRLHERAARVTSITSGLCPQSTTYSLPPALR